MISFTHFNDAGASKFYNLQQYILEKLWKTREPSVLWTELPEGIILDIFCHVDKTFEVPTSGRYKPLKNIEYEKRIPEQFALPNSQSYDELLILRANDLQLHQPNNEHLVEAKAESKLPRIKFNEMLAAISERYSTDISFVCIESCKLSQGDNRRSDDKIH